MKLYNETLDTIATDIKPFYARGKIDHYKAINAETGEKFRIEVKDIRQNWQNTRHVDVESLRSLD